MFSRYIGAFLGSPRVFSLECLSSCSVILLGLFERLLMFGIETAERGRYMYGVKGTSPQWVRLGLSQCVSRLFHSYKSQSEAQPLNNWFEFPLNMVAGYGVSLVKLRFFYSIFSAIYWGIEPVKPPKYSHDLTSVVCPLSPSTNCTKPLIDC